MERRLHSGGSHFTVQSVSGCDVIQKLKAFLDYVWVDFGPTVGFRHLNHRLKDVQTEFFEVVSECSYDRDEELVGLDAVLEGVIRLIVLVYKGDQFET